ncbi:T9SS type A sorting domain-containing protein [Thalassobellus suaedae]|uniref:T9SS type A sorting domain-containing protein n=1 Tax=Thalassobellus suaedae TaxID=3074124 RepID=A0ABY9XS74_9FLAO|nr:T9SS type A sorting domain-containing protein [Flavobacteriaceae bacterium HL-DH14]
MKKIYSSIFILTTAFGLNAQITLTNATSSPRIGDTFTYTTIPNYTFNVEQSGANQTWDFSSATGTVDAFSYIALSNAQEPTSFPLSNIVAHSSVTNSESYYSSSNTVLAIEGLLSTGVARLIYSDKQEFLKYPITYNDVFNETFSGNLENIAAGQTFIRTGTTQINADGFGTLILPYTTVNNVLRIKITNTYSDTFSGFPVSNGSDTIFVWYNANTNNFIASATKSYANDTFVISQATYLNESDLVLGINDYKTTENQLSIYSNPNNNYILVKNNTNKSSSIYIYDTRGRIIKTANIVKGENRINTSSLNSGLYIVKYEKDAIVHTKKIIIK